MVPVFSVAERAVGCDDLVVVTCIRGIRVVIRTKAAVIVAQAERRLHAAGDEVPAAVPVALGQRRRAPVTGLVTRRRMDGAIGQVRPARNHLLRNNQVGCCRDDGTLDRSAPTFPYARLLCQSALQEMPL